MLVPHRVHTNPQPKQDFSAYERRYANRTFETGTMHVPDSEKLHSMRAEVQRDSGGTLFLTAEDMLSPRRIFRRAGYLIAASVACAIADAAHECARALLRSPAGSVTHVHRRLAADVVVCVTWNG